MCVEGLEEGPGRPRWWCLYAFGSDVLIVNFGWELLVNILVMKEYWKTENCPSNSNQQSQVLLCGGKRERKAMVVIEPL